jgi:F-type H+-transporting ATPase subunit b
VRVTIPSRGRAIALAAAGFLLVGLVARGAIAEAPAGRAPAEEAGAEAEGGHHGGGHEVRHLDNWFSLSFGPDKEHQNGPLAFAILNFVILVWLVLRFAKRPLRHYLVERHIAVQKALFEAQDLKKKATAKLEEIEKKIAGLSAEIASIKESVRADAELEKERIVGAAKAEAERLITEADKTLDREVRKAQRLLEAEAVDNALKNAEKLLRQVVNDADRGRIEEDYLLRLAKEGSAPADGGAN